MVEYKGIMVNAGLAAPKASSHLLFSSVAGLCSMCLGPIHAGFSYCYNCNQARQGQYSDLLPESISFLTYAGATEQSRADFHQYKLWNNGPNPGFLRIQSLAADFVAQHAKCMANYVGFPVDSLAFVPSGKAERYGTVSPISKILGYQQQGNIIKRKHPRTVERDQGIDPSRYIVTQHVMGQHVLLFEDTWVTGTNPLSTAVALKQAGASYVSLVVFGRYINPGKYPVHHQWLSENHLVPFNTTFCPVTCSFQCPTTTS